MSQKNEIRKIFKGIILLFFLHILALLAIYALSLILQNIYGGYIALGVWLFGFTPFSLWQLLYVIPICLWLQRKRKILIMKGVIIGAEITFFLNGSCFLLFMISQ